MATTPPPPSPSSLRVPGAPLHGAGYDTFEPYPTRYSARLANRRAIRSNDTAQPRYDPRGQALSSSPQKQKKKAEQVLSPPGSNLTQTPTHTRHVNRVDSRDGSLTGSLNSDVSRFNGSQSSHFSSVPPSTRRSGSQALPTPAKTPSKKKVTNDMSSTARTLFPPSVKKLRKMDSSRNPIHTPMDLSGESESSTSASKSGIEIFTDSRDRVPAAPQEGNPFLSRASQSDDPFTTARGPDGRAVSRPKAKVSLDEMTYMFRGKRHTKKFMEDDEMEEDDPNDLGLFAGREHLLPDPSILQTRTLRRRDYKPRLLWTPGGTPVSTSPRETAPIETQDEPKPAHKSDNEDEATDEEDSSPANLNLMPLCGSVTIASSVATSSLPSADPAFIRRLRSQAREELHSTVTPTPDDNPSPSKSKQTPFHAWLRKKKGPDDASSTASSPKSTTTPAKRDANDEPVGSPAKRTRGNTSHANTL